MNAIEEVYGERSRRLAKNIDKETLVEMYLEKCAKLRRVGIDHMAISIVSDQLCDIREAINILNICPIYDIREAIDILNICPEYNKIK